MQIRFQNSPVETSKMSTTELRANFLITELMKQDQINLVYSHYDRMIVGGVVPGKNKIELANEGELKANYFLERRELGIINGTGGFQATAFCDRTKTRITGLDLKFVVSEWDEGDNEE